MNILVDASHVSLEAILPHNFFQLGYYVKVILRAAMLSDTVLTIIIEEKNVSH